MFGKFNRIFINPSDFLCVVVISVCKYIIYAYDVNFDSYKYFITFSKNKSKTTRENYENQKKMILPSFWDKARI